MSADALLQREFMQLVEAWLEAHPTRTACVSEASLKFAAGKILLMQSGRVAKAHWPGEGATRLAAILLVLFLHEGLLKNKPTILGVTTQELYVFVEKIVRQREISREDLVAAVIEVDVQGTAADVVQHREMDKLFHPRASRAWGSGARDFGARRSAQSASSASSVPVLASQVSLLEAVPEDPDAFRKQVMKLSQAALNLAYGRLFLAPMCGLLLLVGDARQWWSHDARWKLVLFGRGVFFGILIGLAFLVMAITYPDNVNSEGARRFLFPIIMSSSTAGSTNMLFSLFNGHSLYGDSIPCFRMHLLFAVFALSSFGYNASNMILKLPYSWTKLRMAFMTDGVIFMAFPLLLRLVGPPDFYPPGKVPFGSAVGRGLTTLLLGVLATPTTRQTIANLVDSTRAKAYIGTASMGKEMRQLFEADESIIAETASVDQLRFGEGASEDVRRVVRRTLAKRLTSVRIALSLTTVMWFTLVPDAMRVPYLRSALYSLFMGAGLAIIASSFPSDLNSHASRKIIGPVTVACAIGGTASQYSGFYSRQQTRLAMGEPTALLSVHLALFLFVSLLWCTNAILCVNAKYSWSTIRTVVCIDGLAYAINFGLTKSLSLPEAAYRLLPSTDYLAEAAFMRASGPVLIGLFLLSHPNRQRLARMAAAIGWNHVTLPLGQLNTALAKPEADANGAGGEIDSAYPSETKSQTGDSSNPIDNTSEECAILYGCGARV